MEPFQELIKESSRLTGKISKEHPDFLEGLSAFDEAAMAEGVLSTKTKELIAVACSVLQQCTYCIGVHVKAALAAGATREELMEASFVACLMGGGPAWMYAKLVRKAFDDLSQASS